MKLSRLSCNSWKVLSNSNEKEKPFILFIKNIHVKFQLGRFPDTFVWMLNRAIILCSLTCGYILPPYRPSRVPLHPTPRSWGSHAAAAPFPDSSRQEMFVGAVMLLPPQISCCRALFLNKLLFNACVTVSLPRLIPLGVAWSIYGSTMDSSIPLHWHFLFSF